MLDKLKHMKYCVFHPFDGFYEAKNRGKGSYALSIGLIVLFCVLQCVSAQYTGFVMNTNNPSMINSLTIFISYLTVFALIGLSNWTITTLFEGKGKLFDIYMIIGYSLVPVIVAEAVTIFISNFVISEEVALLGAVLGFGWIWFAFMFISGLCTIHEYSLAKNLVTLLATLVAAAIILFLFVLFISLIEQMYGFLSTFISEWIRRAK